MRRMFRELPLTIIGLLPFIAIADSCSSSSAPHDSEIVQPRNSSTGVGAARQGPAVIDSEQTSKRLSPEQLELELDRVNRSPPILDEGQAQPQGPPPHTQTLPGSNSRRPQ